MLLVVTYSQAARTSLRNVCRTHEESVARRLGRAALFEESHHGAFLALRLREKHPDDVQLERTEARTLAGLGDDEFALGAYVLTHEPIDGAEAVVADALSPVREADPLSDAVGDADEGI